MLNENKLQEAQGLLNDLNHMKKKDCVYLKQDRGLIERVNSEKIILTEDNREVLFG